MSREYAQQLYKAADAIGVHRADHIGGFIR
jgi:hypothetical protein